MSRSLKVGWGSLGVSIVVLGLKASAYWVTGSVALYSDALETVINVVAAVGALVGSASSLPTPTITYGHN
jgi:divalent metal cation (Fe/Co/Zn/Cd) transporter